MKQHKYTISSKEGLHARPAAQLSQLASQYKDRVDIIYENCQMTLKSIIGVMSLGIPEGASFYIEVEGHQEEEMMTKIEHLLREEGLIE
jgi:phosphocarrier protein